MEHHLSRARRIDFVYPFAALRANVADIAR